jgi:hypothetical protein
VGGTHRLASAAEVKAFRKAEDLRREEIERKEEINLRRRFFNPYQDPPATNAKTDQAA